MNQHLLDLVRRLAGPLRSHTFVRAVELALERGVKEFVETGCYRGIDGDGQSTAILATVALQVGGRFISVDLNADHVERAKAKVPNGPREIVCRDSVEYLSHRTKEIGLLYLDSYDYYHGDPIPSQVHQVAEIGAAWAKLTPNAIVLLDDCNIPGGGKGLLTSRFLLERGFTLVEDAHQKLFVR